MHATCWLADTLPPPSVSKKHPRTRPNIAPHAVKAREPVNKQTVARCCCCSRALSRARHAAVVFHGGGGGYPTTAYRRVRACRLTKSTAASGSSLLVFPRSRPFSFSLRLPSYCPASSPCPSGRERTNNTPNREPKRPTNLWLMTFRKFKTEVYSFGFPIHILQTKKKKMLQLISTVVLMSMKP